jgi:hypothetical protein
VELVLLPFKAYVLLAFAMAMIFSRAVRVDGIVLWLLGGYAVSCVTLLVGAASQVLSGRRANAISSASFAGLAVLFGWRMLPYLAG